MKQNCPVCFEFLFDSVRTTAVLKCGHTIHEACLQVRMSCCKSQVAMEFGLINRSRHKEVCEPVILHVAGAVLLYLHIGFVDNEAVHLLMG